MASRLISGPALEPVTLPEAKAHLRIDHADEDGLITNLIRAARQHVERVTHRALISQTWELRLNTWPRAGVRDCEWLSLDLMQSLARFVELPVGPVESVVSVETFDEDDQATLWPAVNYYVARAEDRLYRRAGTPWPRPGRRAEGIVITYQAGFGPAADDVPDALKQACLRIVGGLYGNREGAEGPAARGVDTLIAPYVKRRLGQ